MHSFLVTLLRWIYAACIACALPAGVSAAVLSNSAAARLRPLMAENVCLSHGTNAVVANGTLYQAVNDFNTHLPSQGVDSSKSLSSPVTLGPADPRIHDVVSVVNFRRKDALVWQDPSATPGRSVVSMGDVIRQPRTPVAKGTNTFALGSVWLTPGASLRTYPYVNGVRVLTAPGQDAGRAWAPTPSPRR